MTIFLLLLLFFTLLVLRVPIAFSLGISASIFLALDGFNLYMIPQRMFYAIDSTTLIAVPGFVGAGILMARGGISKYLIDSVNTWVGHLPGGMAIVTIVSTMIFASISGSSPATAAAIGSIMIPAMISSGYSKKYAMGLVATAGTLGILIPPSLTLILYGVVSEESIGQLFMAGVVPGIFLGLILLISAIIYARINNFKMGKKATWRERFEASIKAIWAYLLPFIILGSIYSGIATPTEAAIISIFYALVISVFVYREVKWKDFFPIMRETISISSMVYIIISAAMLFSLYLTNERIPQKVAELLTSDLNYWVFMFFVSLLFFILGMFLEAISIVLLTLPILLPVIKEMGINPIHFAIIMVINMEIAMITPPVGLNLFVVKSITKDSLLNVVKGVLPFLLLMILGLIIVIIFPSLSLYLPQLKY